MKQVLPILSPSLLPLRAPTHVPKALAVTPVLPAKKLLCELLSKRLAVKTRPPLVQAVPWSASEHLGIIGPLIGAPSAVLACEPFLHAGVKRLILFGVAGGLALSKAPIALGDILFPRKIHTDDGTSAAYGAPRSFSWTPSPLQLALEKRIVQLAAHHRTGKTLPPATHQTAIWTTDAPNRETQSKLESYHRLGVRGVEMELAALAHLCKIYDAEFAACFVISDLFTPQWTAGFRSRPVRVALEIAARAVAETLKDNTQNPAAPSLLPTT
jgi:uridine phosphorylase